MATRVYENAFGRAIGLYRLPSQGDAMGTKALLTVQQG